MDEDNPLIDRLRGLGRDAIDPGVAARHLSAISGLRVRPHRFVKLKVGTAFAAGLILGGTGLASAGALPAPVQGVAHGALTQVGVSVPNGHRGHGPARYNGPECTGGPYANHGQYVRTHKSDPNAGQSRCGKPVQAANDGATNGTGAPEAPENDQGGTPGASHAGRGHGGKPEPTPSTVVTVPAPLVPSTTIAPANAESTSTSTPTTTKPTSTSTSTTTVESTTTSTSSTTVESTATSAPTTTAP
jgi:hypothetical protein